MGDLERGLRETFSALMAGQDVPKGCPSLDLTQSHAVPRNKGDNDIEKALQRLKEIIK